MPIYEYQCTKCHIEFELLRSISERDSATACKACGSSVRRMMSASTSLKTVSVGKQFGGAEHNKKQGNSAEYNHQNAEFGSLTLTNCTLEGRKVGISVPEGTPLTLKGNKIIAPIPVEIRK